MPYQLEIHLPDNDVETIDIVGPSILGSSEEAELCIQDYDLPPKLCRFRIAQGVLTVMNLGGQKPPLKIGRQKIERGKMYILDDEDVLSFGKLRMIVHELALDEDEDEDEDVSVKTEPEPEPEEDLEDESSVPQFDSTAELLANSTDEEDEDEAPEPTSLSITQVLKQGKEESGEYEAPEKSPKNKKNKEPKSDSSEKTSSRLVQFTQKMKSALVPKRSSDRGPVKVGAPDLVSRHNSNLSDAKITQGWPGVVPRLLAFILEMGGCILLASPLTQRPEIISQWDGLVKKIDQLAVEQPQLQILSEIMTVLQAHGFLAIILFALLQVFVGFIFGRSLGYVFMGINEDSGFITKRIKTLLRSLIFFLTGPFLIFDLPILIKRRSFKEWLTRSALYRPSSWPGVLSSIFLFPPLILGFLLTSVVSQREPISAEFEQLQPAEVGSRLTFDSLDLRFPESSLTDRRTLPHLKKRDRPGFWLYYRGLDQNPIGLDPGPSYSLSSWTHGLLDNNFALPFINEELHQLLESASTPGPLSFQQRQKLEQLFKDSLLTLNLNIQTTIRLLQTYGLDLAVLNMFSKNLKGSLSLKDESKLKWINFLQRDVLWIEREQEDTFEVQLIFLDANPFKSLKAFVPLAEKDMAYELIQEELLQVLPILPGPSPKGEDLENLSHRISDRSLQLFVGASLSTEELDALYKAYFQFTGELLGGSSNLYREQFETQMPLLIDKLADKQNKGPELQEFTQKLQELFSAYQNKKSSFFIEQETDSIDNAQNKGDDI